LPYTTAQKKIKGITWLDDILCSAISQSAVKVAGQEAAAVLRDRHHLRAEEEDDFNIRNPEDIIQAQLEASRTLTILLIAIASISLLVGGIGIMNVMLVSVTERTREVSIRDASSATSRAILKQVLIESIVLAGLGGLIGVGVGISLIFLIQAVAPTFSGALAGFTPVLSLPPVVAAFAISLMIGLIAGSYPAYRAARLLRPRL